MGSIRKKTFTKPMPEGAELFTRKGQQFARWQPAKGKARTAAVKNVGGRLRIEITAKTYTAKYRDAAGIVREVATGCRDEQAARAILAELEREAARIKAGIVSQGEANTLAHARTPIAGHIDAYLVKLATVASSTVHRANVARAIRRVCKECRFTCLADLKAEPFESWLVARQTEGMAARTRNTHRAAMVSFAKWAVEKHRLLGNPFGTVATADERADRRRQRRALNEAELSRLLYVARWRPLADYGRDTIRKTADEIGDKRHGWNAAAVTLDNLDDCVAKARERLADNPAFIAELETRGRERALVYRVLVQTGLRKGELASLTVGQIHLEAEPPFIELKAADEKNRQGASIPLRADLADELAAWIAQQAEGFDANAVQAHRDAPTLRYDTFVKQGRKRDTRHSGKRKGHICQQVTANDKTETDKSRNSTLAAALLFSVPSMMVRTLDRDLAAAGIPKVDDRGRTVDVHALRHTFGTLLSKAGVAPRTAQAAMRHSRIELTMGVYTDPRLLDTVGAVEALPMIPAEPRNPTRQEQRATGTTDAVPIPLAPMLAPKLGNLCQSVSFTGNAGKIGNQLQSVDKSWTVNANGTLQMTCNAPLNARVKGLEPSASSVTG